MTNEFKNINSNAIANTSDSDEKVEERSCFLRGGTIAALWNTIMNYFDKESVMEQNMVRY